MTPTPADHQRATDGAPRRLDDGRSEHLQALSAPVRDTPRLVEQGWQLHELLAPFVAWLATQGLDELDRRRHRAAVERFLRWNDTSTHHGSAPEQRRRYEQHLLRHDPDRLGDARSGLRWWADHRLILARTRLIDH